MKNEIKRKKGNINGEIEKRRKKEKNERKKRKRFMKKRKKL